MLDTVPPVRTLGVEGKNIALDPEGYLLNLGDWSKELKHPILARILFLLSGRMRS